MRNKVEEANKVQSDSHEFILASRVGCDTFYLGDDVAIKKCQDQLNNAGGVKTEEIIDEDETTERLKEFAIRVSKEMCPDEGDIYSSGSCFSHDDYIKTFCGEGYTLVNYKQCEKLPKSEPECVVIDGGDYENCPIDNGLGSKTRVCQSDKTWGSFSSCTATSCNSGFNLLNGQCVQEPNTAKVCPIGNLMDTNLEDFLFCDRMGTSKGFGLPVHKCIDGAWVPQYCKLSRCFAGFRLEGDRCVPNPGVCITQPLENLCVIQSSDCIIKTDGTIISYDQYNSQYPKHKKEPYGEENSTSVLSLAVQDQEGNIHTSSFPSSTAHLQSLVGSRDAFLRFDDRNRELIESVYFNPSLDYPPLYWSCKEGRAW